MTTRELTAITRSFLNQAEIATLDTFDAVIVWGYPLYSHTHSYIHYCWTKTFLALGKPTFWYNDKEYDTQRTYKNCLFIAEGFQDDNIPLDASNTYCVLFPIHPQKYLACGARLIELRFHIPYFDDQNSYWDLNDGTHTLENISEDGIYERLSSNVGISKQFRGLTTTPMNYEALYMYWATDLLPWEINLDDAFITPEPTAVYVGTPYSGERWAEFEQTVKDLGIRMEYHNPWDHPISFQENRDLVKKATFAPDFRNDVHKANGYIPCRIFKNISYGVLPITDFKQAHELFGEHVVYDTDMKTLVKKGIEALADIPRRQAAMKYIAVRHTYVQRARDILRVLGKERPVPIPIAPYIQKNLNQVTFVTALIDIGREKYDGRKFSDYVSWFLPTLLFPVPMVIYVEPYLVDYVRAVRKDLPTRIIPQTFLTSPLRWLLDRVSYILANHTFRQYNPSDLLNRCPEYSILMSNKFAWIWNTIQDNPFQTDLFFWIDAGISRFLTEKHYSIVNSSVHPRVLRMLRRSKRILAQIGQNREQDIQNVLEGKKLSIEEIVGTNNSQIMGGFYGGCADTMSQAALYGMNQFVYEMAGKLRIDNDQVILFMLFQDRPDLFTLTAPTYQSTIPNLALFASGKPFLED